MKGSSNTGKHKGGVIVLFAKEVSEIARQSLKSFGIKPFLCQFKQQTIQNNNFGVNARNPNVQQRYIDNITITILRQT